MKYIKLSSGQFKSQQHGEQNKVSIFEKENFNVATVIIFISPITHLYY